MRAPLFVGTLLHMHCWLFLLLQMIWIQASYAANSDLFRYNRCYAQFTRHKVSAKNELLLQVRESKITGTDACLQLISEADFSDKGLLKNENRDSLSILRTFQSFHRSWFRSYNLNVLTPDYAVTDFFDSNEMGYHVTLSLFSSDYKFSNIVTSQVSYKGVRKASTLPTYIFDDQLGVPTLRNRMWTRGDNHNWKPKLITFGSLIGVEKINLGENMLKVKIGEDANIKPDSNEGRDIFVDANKSLGAGVIGSVPYLLLNSGQYKDHMDGDLKIHRRWSKAVLDDLLCRELPVLKEEDVKNLIDAKNAIPFRRSTQCMQCHATMDEMAGVIRHVQLFNTSQILTKNIVRGVFTHRTRENADRYFKQTPTGSIYFRNFDNKLVKQNFTSLEDMGKWLSETDDLYLCTAKKYFSFLTGQNINIIATAENTTANDTPEKREFLLTQARDLKNHQSLKKLIRNIIDSPYYLERD